MGKPSPLNPDTIPVPRRMPWRGMQRGEQLRRVCIAGSRFAMTPGSIRSMKLVDDAGFLHTSGFFIAYGTDFNHPVYLRGQNLFCRLSEAKKQGQGCDQAVARKAGNKFEDERSKLIYRFQVSAFSMRPPDT